MRIKLTIISLFITLLSCHKEIPIQEEPCIETEQIIDSTTKVFTSKNWKYENHAYALKINDTSHFKSDGFRYDNGKSLGIGLTGRSEDSLIYEIIITYNIPFEIGCYNIAYPHINQTLGIGSEYSTNDDDVIIDAYYTDTAALNNRIEITTLDTINKIVEGYFAISYIYANKRPKRNPNEPYRIRFFNGYFKGVYYE
ncbi:MAG: hypothetical protein IPO72_05875 [Saprospiraceae bacterium]|nr:hypothetical protein [Candidatus Vicinibacter affinis]MBP6174013.1 hypothetical protein [Saprospiraceae bacterium]MBK6572589.1 hypothetical protein [Candidatus Vicinibacter affinis]MBK6824322.1 hypothetical protein [Candidatus Vicinibacter affinis]MBK7303055.1 hypothetical protein [Candidatus Vicinibacter affinis]